MLKISQACIRIVIFYIIVSQLLFGTESYTLAKKIPKSAYLTPTLDTTDIKSIEPQNPKTLLRGQLSILRSFIISKKIPPLPVNLREGNVFNEKNLPATDKNTKWYVIPKWIAGVWHRKYETILTRDEVVMPAQPILSQTDYQMGVQKDKNGNIWTLYQTPKISTIDSDKEQVKNITMDLKILNTKNNKLILKTRSFQIYIDKATNRINKVQQNEIVSIYSPINSKQFQSLSRVDWYNGEGFLIANDERISTIDKVKDFENINNLENGYDAKDNFRKLLTKFGLVSLIPLEEKPVKPKEKLIGQVKDNTSTNYEVINGTKFTGNQIKVKPQDSIQDPRICKPLTHKETKPQIQPQQCKKDKVNTNTQSLPQTPTVTY